MDINKRKNIIKALAAGAAYAVLFKCNSLLFMRFLPDNSYNGIISRAIDAVVLLIAVFALKKEDIFKNKNKGFGGSFTVAGVEVAVIIILLVRFIFSFTDPHDVTRFMPLDEIKKSLIPMRDIVIMLVEMLFVGITEELISRGIVLGLLHDAFGSDTKVNAYLTAAISGAVFGSLHLLNLFGTSNKSAVFIQVLANVGVGFYWGALFLRKRNIFALMLLHSLSDIAVFLSNGYVTGNTSIHNNIDSMSPAALILAAVYVITGVFILRDEKMKYTHKETITSDSPAV